MTSFNQELLAALNDDVHLTAQGVQWLAKTREGRKEERKGVCVGR